MVNVEEDRFQNILPQCWRKWTLKDKTFTGKNQFSSYNIVWHVYKSTEGTLHHGNCFFAEQMLVYEVLRFQRSNFNILYCPSFENGSMSWLWVVTLYTKLCEKWGYLLKIINPLTLGQIKLCIVNRTFVKKKLLVIFFLNFFDYAFMYLERSVLMRRFQNWKPN